MGWSRHSAGVGRERFFGGHDQGVIDRAAILAGLLVRICIAAVYVDCARDQNCRIRARHIGPATVATRRRNILRTEPWARSRD